MVVLAKRALGLLALLLWRTPQSRQCMLFLQVSIPDDFFARLQQPNLRSSNVCVVYCALVSSFYLISSPIFNEFRQRRYFEDQTFDHCALILFSKPTSPISIRRFLKDSILPARHRPLMARSSKVTRLQSPLDSPRTRYRLLCRNNGLVLCHMKSILKAGNRIIGDHTRFARIDRTG